MGRQARFVNWFCSSYLYINSQKTILIDSTYFKTIIKFLTLQNFLPLLGFPLLRYSLLVTSLLCLVTPQHKNHILELNDNIEFTCILHSVVIYIFKLEDSNIHDGHGELSVNEKLIASF